MILLSNKIFFSCSDHCMKKFFTHSKLRLRFICEYNNQRSELLDDLECNFFSYHTSVYSIWMCGELSVCVLSVKWFMIFVCLEFLLYYNTMMHCQLKFIGHFSWSVEISRKRISWRRRRRRCIRIMVFKFKRMMENKWDSSDFHCLQIAKKNWIAFHSFLNF